MIPNNAQKNPSVATNIAVPPIPTSSSQFVQQPTPYDYLTLIPVLITAITPLILALKRKTPSNQNEEES
jgi:hypothetical protein